VSKQVNVAVGQRWAIGGITYEVVSLSGSDPAYPVELVEVAREPRINQELDAAIAAFPEGMRPVLALNSLYAPRSMRQELRWFERRTDARRVA
jgi:hypothetical protein